MANRLIIGCGYIGHPTALRWKNQGDSVWAVTRRSDFASQLSAVGISPLVWNWYDEPLPNSVPISNQRFDTILISVSHAPVPHQTPERTHAAGLENIERAFGGLVDDATLWVYLSTTGVFGAGFAGEWLNEDSPIEPTRPGPIAAWSAESWIRSHVHRWLILRPAGIYGPGRVPNWQAVRDQIPLVMDCNSYLNLIHQEDLVRTIVELSDRHNENALYCVSDGEPPSRKQYYEYIAHLCRFPSPKFVESTSSEGKRSRSDSNKRISADRLRKALSSPFRYPSYKEGLVHVLRDLIPVADEEMA